MFRYWESEVFEKTLSRLGLYYEMIRAEGHKNVKAIHKSTLEITKEDYLTTKGTCIIAIKSNKSAKELSEKIKKLLKQPDNIVLLILDVDGEVDIVRAQSSSRLILTNPTSLVIRKSEYIDDRTVAIKADKAASDINRSLIEKLKQESILKAYLVVIPKQLSHIYKNFIKNPQ